MKDHEILNLAQRFGIAQLLTSKWLTKQFFAFVREIEKRAKEAA